MFFYPKRQRRVQANDGLKIILIETLKVQNTRIRCNLKNLILKFQVKK